MNWNWRRNVFRVRQEVFAFRPQTNSRLLSVWSPLAALLLLLQPRTSVSQISCKVGLWPLNFLGAVTSWAMTCDGAVRGHGADDGWAEATCCWRSWVCLLQVTRALSSSQSDPCSLGVLSFTAFKGLWHLILTWICLASIFRGHTNYVYFWILIFLFLLFHLSFIIHLPLPVI